MSNHTDFDALLLHPGINVQFEKNPKNCKGGDLIILAGSKSVRNDLNWLIDMGWNDFINKHLRYDGKVMGICGGFQMLGAAIHDPEGIEGNKGSTNGLRLLEIETTLQVEKILQKVNGILTIDNTPVAGYEIHAGISQGEGLKNPVMMLEGKMEGAISSDNQIMGTYLHGLFDLSEACDVLLSWAGHKKQNSVNLEEKRELGINLITDTLEQNFDFDKLNDLIA